MRCTLQVVRLEVHRGDAGTDAILSNGAVDVAVYKTIKTTQSGYILVHFGLQEFYQPLLDNCIPCCIELLLGSQGGMRMT